MAEKLLRQDRQPVWAASQNFADVQKRVRLSRRRPRAKPAQRSSQHAFQTDALLRVLFSDPTRRVRQGPKTGKAVATHARPAAAGERDTAPPRLVSWTVVHKKLVCPILSETSDRVKSGPCRNIAVLSPPGLWDLEQLVPSTPSPLEHNEALVAQLARA